MPPPTPRLPPKTYPARVFKSTFIPLTGFLHSESHSMIPPNGQCFSGLHESMYFSGVQDNLTFLTTVSQQQRGSPDFGANIILFNDSHCNGRFKSYTTVAFHNICICIGYGVSWTIEITLDQYLGSTSVLRLLHLDQSYTSLLLTRPWLHRTWLRSLRKISLSLTRLHSRYYIYLFR